MKRARSYGVAIRARLWTRRGVAVLLLVGTVVGTGAMRATSSAKAPLRLTRSTALGRAALGDDTPDVSKPIAGIADPANLPASSVQSEPAELHLIKASGAPKAFDVRSLKSTVVRLERPEDAGPAGDTDASSAQPAQVSQKAIRRVLAASTPAPSPTSSFDGLDFANWGAGHPPDTNGDVGPTYYIQTINSSIGIYDKASGTRVAAFTFNAFMSQGNFGNLCDTDNFGDPVVLYDSFENRWFISDFAFRLDGSGNVNPQHAFQCFAVSKTGDPVSGGWNFYSVEDPGGLGDYPKFGVWPDGIYMSANMFGYSAGASYMAPHVWALNKQQMYAGAPSPQVVDFSAPSNDFTLLPANARLQAGTPPAGTPEYFVSTEQFLNGLSIYKLHVDWDKISTSTFTGPEIQTEPTCWPNATPANASTTANAADVLAIRAMAEAEYSNLAGAESLWVSHTVNRGEFTTANCGGTNTNNATIRWYQANITGGAVAANVVQDATFDPDGTNTFFRYVPSLAIDHAGDMAIGYTKSNSTTNPQIKYAGRLAGDPLNTLGQAEQTLINGTGSQSGNCGSSACIRWGDYSGMALDPDGCTFWETGEYYATSGLNHQTRIGSFSFPGCTTVGNGALSGTVTDGTHAVAGATVTLGARSATTDASGAYTFASLPAGTYPAVSASKAGFDAPSASPVSIPDGGNATRNFTLSAAATSGCFVDNTQTAFQRGVPSNCDLVSSPSNVVLANPTVVDQQNSTVSPTGFGFTNTSWAGQTFTASTSGQARPGRRRALLRVLHGEQPEHHALDPQHDGHDAGADRSRPRDGDARRLQRRRGRRPEDLHVLDPRDADGRHALRLHLPEQRCVFLGDGRLHVQLRDDRLLELESVCGGAARHLGEQRHVVDRGHDGRRTRPELPHVYEQRFCVVRDTRVLGEGREPRREPDADVDDAHVRGDEADRHRRQVPGRREQLEHRPVQLRRA